MKKLHIDINNDTLVKVLNTEALKKVSIVYAPKNYKAIALLNDNKQKRISGDIKVDKTVKEIYLILDSLNIVSLNWGTPSPILVKNSSDDSSFSIRSRGKVDYKIVDPSKLIRVLPGLKEDLSSDDLGDILFDKVIDVFTKGIASESIKDSNNLSILSTPLANYSTKNLEDTFERYGLEIVNFSIMDINAEVSE